MNLKGACHHSHVISRHDRLASLRTRPPHLCSCPNCLQFMQLQRPHIFPPMTSRSSQPPGAWRLLLLCKECKPGFRATVHVCAPPPSHVPSPRSNNPTPFVGSPANIGRRIALSYRSTCSSEHGCVWWVWLVVMCGRDDGHEVCLQRILLMSTMWFMTVEFMLLAQPTKMQVVARGTLQHSSCACIFWRWVWKKLFTEVPTRTNIETMNRNIYC